MTRRSAATALGRRRVAPDASSLHERSASAVGERDVCDAGAVALDADEALAERVLPHGEPRTVATPRVDCFVVGARPHREPRQELDRPGGLHGLQDACHACWSADGVARPTMAGAS